MRYLINALSADAQCSDQDSLEFVVGRMSSCFDVLRPLLEVGAVELIYDHFIESRSLLVGSRSVRECIAKVRDADIRKKWYHYTRNRAIEASSESMDVALTCPHGELIGMASASIAEEEYVLSFSGNQTVESDQFRVITNGLDAEFHVLSYHSAERLRERFPKYEGSPKHGLRRYVREGGELVAPMRLNDEDAQLCLLGAVEDSASLYGLHNGQHYRFMLTERRGDQRVYHGFEVDESEVPRKVVEELKGRELRG